MHVFVLATSLFGASVFGAAYTFPILEKHLGAMDGADGVVVSRSCQIYNDHSGIDLKKVLDLILQPEKEPIQESVHVRQQVPSKQVWVNYPVRFAKGPAVTGLGSRRIQLLQDSATEKQRRGPASDALMKIVEQTCKNL